jgi:hypothetical protein
MSGSEIERRVIDGKVVPPAECGCKPAHPGLYVRTGIPWTRQQLAACGLDPAAWGGRKVIPPDGSPPA